MLFSLANAVEAKDRYTQGHTTRVADLAMSLGEKIGLDEKEMKALRIGGMLHDIGKIGIPENILNKPGPLDEAESGGRIHINQRNQNGREKTYLSGADHRRQSVS